MKFNEHLFIAFTTFFREVYSSTFLYFLIGCEDFGKNSKCSQGYKDYKILII